MKEYIEHYKNNKGVKHGCYYEPWYGNYRAMMDRCYCSKVDSYPQYGGAGITVCDEWHDIRNFKKWADISGFKKGLTLDRIDGTKGYSPENCRWATMKEQTNNRYNTIFYEYKGEKRALTDWASMFGISRYTLYSRIKEQGWSVEKALETPVKKRKRADMRSHHDSLCDQTEEVEHAD